MPMYNLIKYSDNYFNTSGSLWGFKRDETSANGNVTNGDNALSFECKSSLITKTKTDRTRNGIKTAVPLKYLSNFWRSLEMPLINCKVELFLRQIDNYLLITVAIGADANTTGADSPTFKITDAKLYVPAVTLSTENSGKLAK